MRSVSNMPWLSNATSNPSQIDRQKDLAGLKYPIFNILADDTDDPYWKNFLYAFAKGKLFKGFVFNGRTLMYKNGTLQLEINNGPNITKKLIEFILNRSK